MVRTTLRKRVLCILLVLAMALALVAGLGLWVPVMVKADGVIQIDNLGSDGDSGMGWTVSGTGTVVTITANGSYVITMQNAATPTSNRIVVAAGATNVTLTLAGINIQNPSGGEALNIAAGSTVSAILQGANTLAEDASGGGVDIFDIYGSVTISGDGSLACSTRGNAIAVEANASLTIQSGSVTAISLDETNNVAGSAGIRLYAATSSLNISGGTVVAKGGAGSGGEYGGAGIGGGGNNVGSITITGGVVTATGGAGGASNPTAFGYDIGSGGGSGDAGSFTLDGNALVTLTTYGYGPTVTGITSLLNGQINDASTSGNPAGHLNIGGSYGTGYTPPGPPDIPKEPEAPAPQEDPFWPGVLSGLAFNVAADGSLMVDGTGQAYVPHYILQHLNDNPGKTLNIQTTLGTLVLTRARLLAAGVDVDQNHTFEQLAAMGLLGSGAPQTGDAANTTPWVIFSVLALAGLSVCGASVLRKRRRS